MELRHLRYFAAVSEHGSFNRAAATLRLTQPALSRQVKDLEEELGVALVKRGVNAVALTPMGEIFYAEVIDVLARVDQAVQRLRERGRAGSLRVGFSPSLISGIMPRAIERFHAVSPHVRLELSDLASREMAEMARARRIDLLIAPAGISEDLGDYSWTVLRKLAPVLVLARKHPLSRCKSIQPASLRPFTLQGLNRRDYPEYAANMRALLKPFGFVPRIDPDGADGVMSLFAGLEAKNGAAILTEGVGAMLPRGLVMRPFAPKLAPIVISMGRPSAGANPHAEAFQRLLQEAVLAAGRAG